MPDLPLTTGDPLLDDASAAAMEVIERNLVGAAAGGVTAGKRYPKPWLRDTYDGGIVPCPEHPLFAPYIDALPGWAARQGGTPVYVWREGKDPHWRRGGDRCEPGQVCTNRSSGDHDESALFVSAVRDACLITGRADLLALRPAAEAAWGFLRRSVPAGTHLPDVQPLVACDWADQIHRRGVATGLVACYLDATRALADLATLAGDGAAAARHAAEADAIRAEANATLWRTGVPSTRHAPPPGPAFGHYLGWRADGRDFDYFETDANCRAIVSGLADAPRAAEIVGFLRRHRTYFLGPNDGSPPAAKVCFGDYAPADLASIRERSGDGRYHTQHWGWVGALAADACARAGAPDLARHALRGVATALVLGARARTGIREWYDVHGVGHDSEWFQWSARAYLVALSKVWLGAALAPEGLTFHPLAPGIDAHLTFLGRRLRVRTARTGPHAAGVRIAAADLGDGAEITIAGAPTLDP